MKQKSQNKFAIIRNIIVFIMALYILINHKNVHIKTEDIHYKFIEHANLNPMQFLKNGVYYCIQYIADFIYYRIDIENKNQFFIQYEGLLQELKKTKSDNTELISILQPLQSMQNTFPVKYVVKLIYFVSEENEKQIYFQSNDSIPINSLVFNGSCLIGRVFKKHENNYYILTHQDENFRIPAYTKNTQIFGMIYGNPYKMKFVSFDEIHQHNIEENEKVLTASSEGKFIENIEIGSIIKHKSYEAFIETDCKNYYSYGLVI